MASPRKTPKKTNKTARLKAKLRRKNKKRVLRMSGALKGKRDRGQRKSPGATS